MPSPRAALPIWLKVPAAFAASSLVKVLPWGIQAQTTQDAPRAFASLSPPAGSSRRRSKPMWEAWQRSPALSRAARCSAAVWPQSPAVSTSRMPIGRTLARVPGTSFLSCSRRLYSCSPTGPLRAVFTSGTSWARACPGRSAAAPTPAAIVVRKSRREVMGHLDDEGNDRLEIPRLDALGQVVRGAPGQGQDGKGGVLLGGVRERRAVHHEHVLHLVHLVEGVQGGPLGVGAHAAGAVLVDGRARRVQLEIGRAHV